MTLESNDPNLSPMVNIVDGAGIVLGRNVLNNPIENYAFDGRVNLSLEDPHASTYISKQVLLSNQQHH